MVVKTRKINYCICYMQVENVINNVCIKLSCIYNIKRNVVVVLYLLVVVL